MLALCEWQSKSDMQKCVPIKVHPPCTTSVKLRSLSPTELLAAQKNTSSESLSIRFLSVYRTLCMFEFTNSVRFSTSSFPAAFLLLISTNVAAGTAFAPQKRDRVVLTFFLNSPVKLSPPAVRKVRSGATESDRIQVTINQYHKHMYT